MPADDTLTAYLRAKEEVSDALDNIAEGFGALDGVMKGFRRTADSTESEVNQVGDSIEDLGTNLDALPADVSIAKRSLESLGDKMDDVRDDALGLAGGIQAIRASAISLPSDVDMKVDAVRELKTVRQTVDKSDVSPMRAARSIQTNFDNFDTPSVGDETRSIRQRVGRLNLPSIGDGIRYIRHDVDRPSLPSIGDVRRSVGFDVDSNPLQSLRKALDGISLKDRSIGVRVVLKGVREATRKLRGLTDRERSTTIVDRFRSIRSATRNIRETVDRASFSNVSDATRNIRESVSSGSLTSVRDSTRTIREKVVSDGSLRQNLRDSVVHTRTLVDEGPLDALTGRLSALRDRAVDVDTDVHDGPLTALKAHLATLRDKTVNVDVDTDKDSLKSLLMPRGGLGGIGNTSTDFGPLNLPLKVAAPAALGLGASLASGLTTVGAGAIGAGGLAVGAGAALFANTDKNEIKRFKKALDYALEPLRNPTFDRLSTDVLRSAVSLVNDFANVTASLSPVYDRIASQIGEVWAAVRPATLKEFRDLMVTLAPIVASLIASGLRDLPGLLAYLDKQVKDMAPGWAVLGASVARFLPALVEIGKLINWIAGPILAGMLDALSGLGEIIRDINPVMKKILQNKAVVTLLKMLGAAIVGILGVLAIGALVTAVTVLGTLVSTIGLIPLAIGAVIGILLMFRKKIGAIFKGIVRGVLGILNSAIKKVNSILPKGMEIGEIDTPNWAKEGKPKPDRKNGDNPGSGPNPPKGPGRNQGGNTKITNNFNIEDKGDTQREIELSMKKARRQRHRSMGGSATPF